MMMMGEIADAMPMSAGARERHEKLRAAKFREVVEQGVFYGQPHSEPVEHGADGHAALGGRPAVRHHRAQGGRRLCRQRPEVLRLARRRRALLRHAGHPDRRGALDRAHALSADPEGRAGRHVSRRVGSDGHARHGEPRHAPAGRVRPRRRRGVAAGAVRRHVQRLSPSLAVDLRRDVPRADAGGLRWRHRLPDRPDGRLARAAHRGGRQGHAIAEMLFALEAARPSTTARSPRPA